MRVTFLEGSTRMTVETPEETRPALADLAATFGKDVEALENSARAVGKAVKDVARAFQAGESAKALAALQKLEKSTLPSPEMTERLKSFTGQVKAHLDEEDRRLKFYLAKHMRDAAAHVGMEVGMLTTDPPEFRLGPLTALFDLSRRSASVRYARLELEKVAATPEAVLEACRRGILALEGKGFDAERYFHVLLDAYKVRLTRTNQPMGSRVELADLLAEIAFSMQSERFYDDPQRENFVPYSRVQFAYDLARLRRAGKLSHQGLRLALGSATAGTTKQKSRVLYIEDERGNGQYYLTLWFSTPERIA
ncbi:MAG: hypothetical protein FJX76_06000 [Armatimonadetes bacterium]|nr:hypothetical protein [Armatimonadota bacterium]